MKRPAQRWKRRDIPENDGATKRFQSKRLETRSRYSEAECLAKRTEKRTKGK